jgi:cold shock protein
MTERKQLASNIVRRPQGGGKDVFVHISAVERAGLMSLNEGQAIEFELVSSRGKTSAEQLKVRR